MAEHPYLNDAAPDERRDLLRDHLRAKQQASTYHGHTHIDEESGGRFARLQPTRVIGSEPVVDYPAAPNWANDPSGDEAPIGYDINAQEPTGTIPEIKASIANLSSAVAPPAGGVARAPATSPSEQPCRPPTFRRRV